MPTTFQLLRAGNGKIIRSASGKPFGNNVSAAATNFANGARRRMPYAVSRDLQPTVISGKELYFRVTHSDLRTVANGGLSQTGHDFQFETIAGVVVPYVVKSYDAVAGTLFGVFVNNLAGSAAATRGYLYFNNPIWTASREDNSNTFLNGNTCLFLPSGINQTDIGLDMSGDLPTSDKTIVNPGALLNGSTDYIWRAFLGTPINSFLISCYCQDLDANSDNAMWAVGLEGGNTVIFIRRLFGTASGPTGGETNAWRFGWVTTEPGAGVTSSSYYETATNTSGTNLQHVVIRRFTDGTDPEIYLNGVLSPLTFKSTPLTANAALRGPIATSGQRLLVGRGSTATRFWHGYLDCFKFYSRDNKSTAWAKSEYDNLLDINGAVIFGDPETVATATMFGEVVGIACNGLSNFTFAADKYVVNSTPAAGSPPATPSIHSLTQPAGGSLAVTAGNDVRYSNTSNADPDNAGAVVMTNGSGTVTVPLRATITPVTPPPPGGYYKTPNIAGKTSVDAGSRGAVGTPGTLLWAIAQFAAGTFLTSKRYIRITGPITGADVTVNTGGDSVDPLVIMMAAPAGADNWTSRASTKITGLSLILTREWTWCYGLYGENIPAAANTNAPELVTVNASNCFVTCCRIGGSHCVANQAVDAVITNLTVNFNRLEMSMQSVSSSTGGDTGVRLEGNGQSAAFRVATQTTCAYNLVVDHAIQRVVSAKNAIAFYCGNGVGDQTFHDQTGSVYEFNFINSSLTRGFEFKYGPKWIKNNHILGLNSQYAGINCRGGNVHNVIIDNNRVVNVGRSQIQGGDHKVSNLWHIDNAGASSGKITLSPQEKPISTPKWVEAGDGSVLVGCKGNVQLPCIFEIYPYDGFSDPVHQVKNYTINAKLGQIRPVIISAHVAGAFTGANDETITFDGAGHPTGVHDALTNSGITKQTAVLAGYSVTTPPVLSAIICGPNDGNGIGKVWGT